MNTNRLSSGTSNFIKLTCGKKEGFGCSQGKVGRSLMNLGTR